MHSGGNVFDRRSRSDCVYRRSDPNVPFWLKCTVLTQMYPFWLRCTRSDSDVPVLTQMYLCIFWGKIEKFVKLKQVLVHVSQNGYIWVRTVHLSQNGTFGSERRYPMDQHTEHTVRTTPPAKNISSSVPFHTYYGCDGWLLLQQSRASKEVCISLHLCHVKKKTEGARGINFLNYMFLL